MQRCTRVENLRITSQYVSSEMLTVSSCIVCLSAYKSYRATTVQFTFQMTLRKSKVLLGPVKEEAMRHHRNKKSPAVETNGEVQPC